LTHIYYHNIRKSITTSLPAKDILTLIKALIQSLAIIYILLINQMETIDIKRLSPRVLSKMKQGKPFRITKGTGFSLAVHSSRVHPIQRKFNQNKGHEVALTQEELNANQSIDNGIHSSKASSIKAIPNGSGLYAGGSIPPRSRYPTGFGTYAGQGLDMKEDLVRSTTSSAEKLKTIKIHHKSLEKGVLKGKIINPYTQGLPPALTSQPYSENFRWQSTLSPIYHRFMH